MKAKVASIQERELHDSILNGSDMALSKLYDLHGESVIQCLKSRYPKVTKADDAMIMDAVTEAFFGYYRNPSTFNPDMSSLHRFLEIAAERDLINILEREKKHRVKKELPEDVELQEKFWNSAMGTTETTDGQIIQEEVMQSIDQEMAKHFDLEKDVLIAKLILAKERKTEVFAEILGIEDLSYEEQRSEVKKHKDRIKKVIERHSLEQKIKALTK